MSVSDANQDCLEQLAQRAAQEFVARYSEEPEFIVAAPGRVNLIGEHTDYNDGFVLPMAIERHVVLAARKASQQEPARIDITSASVNSSARIDLTGAVSPGEPVWSNYCRGVVAGFFERNIALPSLDVVLVSDVPLGGGLSSSAAVEVATATLLEVAAGVALDGIDKARLCRKAEHEFAGVPCGIMDQLISVLGDPRGALLIDCENESVRVIPIMDPSVSVLIMNTNVRHNLAGGEYAMRRQQCHSAAEKLGVGSLRAASLDLLSKNAGVLDELEYKRARHVISENARATEAAHALSAGELTRFGQLMYQSHESLRTDFDVSCRELDVLVDSARAMGEAGGVLGARMTGGGFGGCTITLVKNDDIDRVRRRMAAEYEAATGRVASGFVSRPGRGAHRIPTFRRGAVGL